MIQRRDSGEDIEGGRTKLTWWSVRMTSFKGRHCGMNGVSMSALLEANKRIES